jgi:hypothetical protein
MMVKNIVAEIAAVENSATVPDITADNSAVGNPYRYREVMKTDNLTCHASNAYQSIEFAVLDQGRVEGVTHQHIIPAGGSIQILLEQGNLLFLQMPIAFWIFLVLDVPQIILILSLRKKFRGNEPVSEPHFWQYHHFVIHG